MRHRTARHRLESIRYLELRIAMYWDVVEVRPEPEYYLFVRFKDGLTGRVQLRSEELTGVLSRLRDAEFFQQVFIDSGAVAWPQARPQRRG